MIFITSDTWFNRPIYQLQDIDVVEYNDMLIAKWNEVVSDSDDVYVLGGFGVSDLYHIVIRLKGNIHFLNNYYTEDEKMFINDMKKYVNNSTDQNISNRIFFHNEQIMTNVETDCVMSYFPLADWIGKNTGTFNFHGFYKNNDFVNHNVSCNTYDWDFYPVNIEKIKKNIANFEEKM